MSFMHCLPFFDKPLRSRPDSPVSPGIGPHGKLLTSVLDTRPLPVTHAGRPRLHWNKRGGARSVLRKWVRPQSAETTSIASPCLTGVKNLCRHRPVLGSLSFSLSLSRWNELCPGYPPDETGCHPSAGFLTGAQLSGAWTNGKVCLDTSTSCGGDLPFSMPQWDFRRGLTG
jgi:hypothetical protein